MTTTRACSRLRRRRAPGRAAMATAALATVLATAACGGQPQEPATNPHATLLARPSVEQAVARYQQMQQRIQAELDTALGPHHWIQYDNGDDGNCGSDFPHEPHGRIRALPLIGFEAGIPDDQWPRTARIVTRVIADYGFTTAGSLIIDKPGHHELNGHDPALDAYFNLGTQLATSMQTTTGCHLPAAEKPPL